MNSLEDQRSSTQTVSYGVPRKEATKEAENSSFLSAEQENFCQLPVFFTSFPSRQKTVGQLAENKGHVSTPRRR